MALNNTILNVGANAMRSEMRFLSLHYNVPDGAGSSESTAPRRPSAWAVPDNGDLVSASINFTGGQANGPVRAVGFWNVESGGTFFGYYPVATGDQLFNGEGNYLLGAFTLIGGST